MIERTLFESDHQAFADSFQRFVEKEIIPFHADWEDQGYVDRAVWHKAGENGFLCMTLPEEYGGAGADRLYSVLQMEAIARNEAMSGVPTGFAKLDAMTNGLHPGQMVIVAARPGEPRTMARRRAKSSAMPRMVWKPVTKTSSAAAMASMATWAASLTG